METIKYYTYTEISNRYNNLTDKERISVLYGALLNMQQNNSRSRFLCIAMAMGYDNYEGLETTYYKK